MRDIVNSNGFSETKSKVVKMPNNSSGTLTRADYRSYRGFLGSYGDNKNSKDDQESVSSNESGISSCNLSESKSNNTSTSSLNSEISGTSSKNLPKTEQNTGVASRTGSFRKYLESYNNKKFSSVQPGPPKQNTVKSEIVIQVNDPLEQQKILDNNEPVFVTTINGDELEKDSIDSFSPPPNFLPPPPNFLPPAPPKILNGYQNRLNCCLPPPPPPPFETPKSNHQDGNAFIPPPPPQLPNNGHDGGCVPPPPPPPPKLPDLNKSSTCEKKWGTVEVDDQSPKSKPNQSEKHPANHAAATNLAKILTQHLLPRRKALESQLNATSEDVLNKPTPTSPPSKVINEQTLRSPAPVPKLPQNGHNNNTPSQNYTCYISLQPQISNLSNPSQTVPPPPKLPLTAPPKIDYSTLPKHFQKITVPQLPRSPPPKFETHYIPKQSQKTATVELSAPKLPQTSPPKVFNGRNGALSPPPKIDYSTFPRQPQKPTAEVSVPKLPRPPLPKFETHYISNQSQKTATVELPAPKLPQTALPKVINGRNGALSPSPKIDYSTFPRHPQKPTVEVEESAPKLPQTSPPKAISGRNSPSDGVDFNTTTVVPVNDASTKVSKNDPNVRKLVYNTYRGFLGAYNNKANDMIATLPRSRVSEDQGVSKQLESMALQGGLEKLNGRTNPNVEQDEGHNQ